MKQKQNETVHRALRASLRNAASTARRRVALEQTQGKKQWKPARDGRKGQVASCHCGRNALHQNGLPREVLMYENLLRIDAGEKTM